LIPSLNDRAFWHGFFVGADFWVGLRRFFSLLYDDFDIMIPHGGDGF